MPSDTNTVPEFHRTRHGNDDRRPELDGSGRVRLSCSGIHWFDRTTGVNVLLEEISIAPELWARAPRYVSIALTNACELKCPFCYAPKTPARLEARQTLSWVEELDDTGAHLRRHPHTLDLVCLDGSTASLTRDAPAGFEGKLLYLRRDLLASYAGDRLLLHLAWGERQVDFDFANPPGWLEKAGSAHADLWRHVRLRDLAGPKPEGSDADH